MIERIKEIMYHAIEETRPTVIEKHCRKIWNQPFFYRIDKARALTISYNPTDKGAHENYPGLLKQYQTEGCLPTAVIFDTLYNFKIEPHWRTNYNYIFGKLGIGVDEIAHTDISSFPYIDFQDFLYYRDLDTSNKYVLECLELLLPQLDYLWIDGSKNRRTLDYVKKDFIQIHSTKLPINKGAPHDLIIYKHTTYKTFLIYYGSPIWGRGMPSKEGLDNLVKHVLSITKNGGR